MNTRKKKGLGSGLSALFGDEKPSEKPQLAQDFMKRLMGICTTEGIEYEPKVLAELVMKFFPDFRRCLNEVQRYGIGGVIDTGLLSTLSEEKLTPLIDMIKEKNWSSKKFWWVRKYCKGRNGQTISNNRDNPHSRYKNRKYYKRINVFQII